MSRRVCSSAAAERVAAGTLRDPRRGTNSGLLSMATGEPEFDTPPQIVAAAAEALADGATHYAHKQGTVALREALAHVVSRAAGRPFGVDDVLITHGGTGGLTNAIVGLVDPGDRVVLPDPTYSLFADLVHLVGGECVRVPCTPELRWDLDALGGALQDARLFVFCNPCNPTGVVHSRKEIEYLAAAVAGTDTLVLADEAYSALTFDDDFCSALSIAGLADRLVYCQTFSKAYAMTGWRIGYLAAPRELLEPAIYVQATTSGAVNTAVQQGALIAVATGDADIARMRRAYAHRREVLLTELEQLKGIDSVVRPGGAFYVFVRYNSGAPAISVVATLREHGVVVRPGSEFGPAGEGHLRLSYAADAETIREGVRRMGHGLDAMG